MMMSVSLPASVFQSPAGDQRSYAPNDTDSAGSDFASLVQHAVKDAQGKPQSKDQPKSGPKTQPAKTAASTSATSAATAAQPGSPPTPQGIPGLPSPAVDEQTADPGAEQPKPAAGSAKDSSGEKGHDETTVSQSLPAALVLVPVIESLGGMPLPTAQPTPAAVPATVPKGSVPQSAGTPVPGVASSVLVSGDTATSVPQAASASAPSEKAAHSPPAASPEESPTPDPASVNSANLADPASAETSAPADLPKSLKSQVADYKLLKVESEKTQSASPQAGMSAASVTDTMRKARETDETASTAGQNLPTVAGEVTSSSRPVAAAPKENPNERVENAGERTNGLTPLVTATERPVAQAHDSASIPAESSTPVRTVEAVHRAIESTTVNMQRMAAASVSMVLKPDTNTQLALHVKWQQGHFEALAVLERGDFSSLGAQWTQLQHRLAEQGVRLAPLVAG